MKDFTQNKKRKLSKPITSGVALPHNIYLILLDTTMKNETTQKCYILQIYNKYYAY